jgi:hypothetical protein
MGKLVCAIDVVLYVRGTRITMRAVVNAFVLYVL